MESLMDLYETCPYKAENDIIITIKETCYILPTVPVSFPTQQPLH